uniref:Uncharacterized protein n=1 Tax=viral metagenome TaxID=1070528 RepID=A0A6M3KZI4_9ZZZZ
MQHLNNKDKEVIECLSPWHKGIARRVAEGKRGKEICREMQVSASRLSVLKGTPIMKRAVRYYEGIVEKGFQKARQQFDKAADDIAKIVVTAITDDKSTLTTKEKVAAGLGVLDRIGIKAIERKQTVGEGQMLFEQTLRVIKNDSLHESSEPNEFDQVVDSLIEVP